MAAEEDGWEMIIRNQLNQILELQTPAPNQQQPRRNEYALLLEHLQNRTPPIGALLPQPRAPFNPLVQTENPIAEPNANPGPLYLPGPLVQLGTTGALQQISSPPNQINYTSAQDQSIHIPEEQNTSVWITNLPPTCTYAELLLSVRRAGPTGKIFATVINPPQANHTTSAAKIVFFSVEGKTRLLSYAASGAFSVGAFLPNVIPNRIRTPARMPGPESRVLFISGPSRVVNRDSLCAEFQKFCAFDLEYVKRVGLSCDPGRASMEWAFGSYRCQAERVYNAIQRKKAEFQGLRHDFEDVEIRWGHDPCALSFNALWL
ncbi:hypothetical protein RRF57_007974 [Xylaria bambusicola]|uniref:RRM domain-containing protein n=1 Tax=Xylaria bambusicola TaxID=326684 RepID=A0AAN7UH00_9PEZI